MHLALVPKSTSAASSTEKRARYLVWFLSLKSFDNICYAKMLLCLFHSLFREYTHCGNNAIFQHEGSC